MSHEAKYDLFTINWATKCCTWNFKLLKSENRTFTGANAANTRDTGDLYTDENTNDNRPDFHVTAFSCKNAVNKILEVFCNLLCEGQTIFFIVENSVF